MTSAHSTGPKSSVSKEGSYRLLPSSIWVLGFGSMFMDISSEMIHSLLPIFMANVLGASMISIGVIEGIAEAGAAVVKVFSGVISDHFRKRKLLVVLGYGLSAISKPVFPLATTIWWVFGARFIDRIGKGIRGAPRDAMVADMVPNRLRGAAYGLRQALDSLGAFFGPTLALVLMIWLMNDIETVMWFAVGPAFIAVFLFMFAVSEPETPDHSGESESRIRSTAVCRLSGQYWFVVAVGAIFTLARFSEAFLILRAQDVGLGISYLPAVLVLMNLVYALFAYPAGAAADRLSARSLLLLGLGVLMAADILLAMAVSPTNAFVGAALWGLHMAFTQGLFSKLVADTAPVELRGTAFGIYNLVTGVMLLLASTVAGILWSEYGAPVTFVAGASFAAVAAMGLLVYSPDGRPSTPSGF